MIGFVALIVVGQLPSLYGFSLLKINRIRWWSLFFWPAIKNGIFI